MLNKHIVDDMVIIKDDDKLPRLRWKKGVIQELITGRDNNVRGAVVRVIDNKGKIITLKRDCTFTTCEKHRRRRFKTYSCRGRRHHSKKYGVVTTSMVTRWEECEK